MGGTDTWSRGSARAASVLAFSWFGGKKRRTAVPWPYPVTLYMSAHEPSRKLLAHSVVVAAVNVLVVMMVVAVLMLAVLVVAANCPWYIASHVF